jgi:uncharacterized protein YjbI with pentapeptide repeats
MKFMDCSLDLSSFYKLQLKSTLFQNCSLKEVDFTETNLTKAKFKECDLLGAIFDNCNLEHTNFQTAINYSFDPERNRIKKAKFSYDGIGGLLDKYDIIIN